MKATRTFSLSILTTLCLMHAANSQQAAGGQQQGPGAVPIEIYACTFREGMGLADLEPFHDRYNRILDRNDITDVAAYIMLPEFRHASDDHDFLYMGRWASGAAMGRGHAMQRSDEYQELLAEWGEVIACPTHSYFVGGLVAPPSPARDEADEAPFQTLSCTLNEGNAIGAAFQAISNYAEGEAGSGTGDGNGHALWIVAAGEEPNPSYDFKWTILFPSYEHFGESFDALWNRGGAASMFSAFGSVMSCDAAATRLYNQLYIRRME